MSNFVTKFSQKAEIRESKDEILLGEIVRAMSRQGRPAIAFVAEADRRRLRFLAVGDPLLHSICVVLERKTGKSLVSSSLLGTKASLTFTVEVKNRLARPEDLVSLYRNEIAELVKVPVTGGVKLGYEPDGIYASQTKHVDMEDYVLKGEEGARALMELIDSTVAVLRERLVPFGTND